MNGNWLGKEIFVWLYDELDDMEGHTWDNMYYSLLINKILKALDDNEW